MHISRTSSDSLVGKGDLPRRRFPLKPRRNRRYHPARRVKVRESQRQTRRKFPPAIQTVLNTLRNDGETPLQGLQRHLDRNGGNIHRALEDARRHLRLRTTEIKSVIRTLRHAGLLVEDDDSRKPWDCVERPEWDPNEGFE
jgi:hypothetical protein